jgi:hypothetical protein
MSAKTSFDIQRKKASAPVRAKRKAAPRREAPVRRAKSLRARRQEARNRMTVLVLFIMLLIAGGVLYFFWRPEVRITDIKGAADIPDAARAAAHDALAGTYYGIIPRDSVFFYPEKNVAAAALEAAPTMKSLSVSRDSFHSLTISGSERTAAFYWCGSSPEEFTADVSACYESDIDGLIFAEAPVGDASTTDAMLRIYAPLDAGSSTSPYPLRYTVEGASYLPQLLSFEKEIQALGAPVLAIAIRDDEATLIITPTTVVKYVLGHEAAALELAKATFPTLDLLGGSIEYVDLRFEGKVYVKRYKE